MNHMDTAQLEQDVYIQMATQIVSAYVGNNEVDSDELPALIQKVHNSIQSLNGIGSLQMDRVPAVPIDESITDEFIVCLEDGKKFKSLKRHLRSKYGLSPEEYRMNWGLPSDYPMVAPGYSRKRSKLAKKMGLGKN